jgi:hypothetical protein
MIAHLGVAKPPRIGFRRQIVTARHQRLKIVLHSSPLLVISSPEKPYCQIYPLENGFIAMTALAKRG